MDSAKTVRFGDDVELDLAAHQLRRSGRVLRLERIPFEVLCLLVEHAGHVVGRNQIVEQVWGKDVFLDTDNSINGAIRKIRLVLRDHPDHPRFIETIAGSGYRFIAPVRALVADEPPAPVPGLPPAIAAAPGDHAWTQRVPAWRQRRLRAALAMTAIVAVGAWLAWFRSAPQPMPGGRVMLAVLPFENLTGDTEQEYFSDGLTEELIAQLGRLDPQRLGVIARTSVMRYKHTTEGLATIGRELGVQYLLEGSVRRDSRRVRITAQLVEVRDQAHVWARQYDREERNVLSVQAEIADAVAVEVQLTLSGRRTGSTASAVLSPTAYEAYDLYLKGRYFWNRRTAAGFKLAIQSFEQAIAIDARHARAHAGLADAYALMAAYGHASQQEVIPKARAAAIRALQIDETLAEAHTSLALITEQYDWEWKAAENEFRRALELDPNYVTAHHWYAEFLSFQGRFDEAFEQSARARELDPLSLIIATDQGAILYYSRRYEPAIRQFRAVLAVEPAFPRANLIVGAYLQSGRLDDALAHLDRWHKLEDGPWPWAWSAHVHGRKGNRAEAERALQRMEEANRRELLYAPPLYATAYAGIGDKDEAFAWLQRACSDRSPALAALKVDPVFDVLRGDPRFNELLRCVKLDR